MAHEWWCKLNLTSLLTESLKDKKQTLLIFKMLFLYGKKLPLIFPMNKILFRRNYFLLQELELLYRYLMCHFLLKYFIMLNKYSEVAVAHTDYSVHNFMFLMLLYFCGGFLSLPKVIYEALLLKLKKGLFCLCWSSNCCSHKNQKYWHIYLVYLRLHFCQVLCPDAICTFCSFFWKHL